MGITFNESSKQAEGVKTIMDTENEMYKTNPSRYFWMQGKREEINLRFDEAAHFYAAAYNAANRSCKSTAIRYKWDALRCVEMNDIYLRLMHKQDTVHRVGLLEDGVLTVHWTKARDVFPMDIYQRALSKMSVVSDYHIVRHNRTTNAIDFVTSHDFFQKAEPTIGKIRRVTAVGTVLDIPQRLDPEIQFNKWALGFNGTDFKASMRRSIKLEYLELPPAVKEQAKNRAFFEKNVAPYIGNRNVGKYLNSLKKSVG